MRHTLAEALCYKPEGHGFFPDKVSGIFPSSSNLVLVSTKPLTEMSTTNRPGDKGQLARKADNLTAICELTV
jgi:hypothetical protein